MTEKISHIISEIETKFFALKERLDAETKRNEELSAGISSLTETNDSLVKTVLTLESELDTLKKENKELQEKSSTQPALVDGHNKDLEIDFLVREIDQCINQIKSSL